MRTYQIACSEYSDIHQHLPTLKRYASECSSIMEIGLGFGNSTLAFLEAMPGSLRTIEIDPNCSQEVRDTVYATAQDKGVNYKIIYGNSCAEETASQCSDVDFLFIDGDHSYLIVKKELEMYGPKAKKYIGFHDIVIFGHRDMVYKPDQVKQGINYAIEEFLAANPEWAIDYVSIFNNGLLILKRN